MNRRRAFHQPGHRNLMIPVMKNLTNDQQSVAIALAAVVQSRNADALYDKLSDSNVYSVDIARKLVESDDKHATFLPAMYYIVDRVKRRLNSDTGKLAVITGFEIIEVDADMVLDLTYYKLNMKIIELALSKHWDVEVIIKHVGYTELAYDALSKNIDLSQLRKSYIESVVNFRLAKEYFLNRAKFTEIGKAQIYDILQNEKSVIQMYERSKL